MPQTEPVSVQWYPLGDAALVVQFGNEIAYDIHQKVKAFTTYLEQHPFEGMIEYVPAFTTVTIYYQPWIVSEKGRFDAYERVVQFVETSLAQVKAISEQKGNVIEIPVCYGDAYGPDLNWVTSHAQLSIEEVIAIHTAGEYLVYMIGFAPGFPYLGGMDEKIAAPRKEKPRSVIPAGSVGIAGKQTGVYPMETPGGWQLIGRTPLSLFNPHASPPSLLKAGDIVRFVSISLEEYVQRKKMQHEPTH
jgi:inhibitor of KinA